MYTKYLIALFFIYIFQGVHHTFAFAPSSVSHVSAVKISFDNGAVSNVSVAWKDNSSNETFFKILRKKDTGDVSLLATTSPNVTKYQDMSLATGTYSYAVQSCTQEECSLPVYSSKILVMAPTSTPVTTHASTTPKQLLTRTLAFGTQGEDVKVLQTVLFEKGFYPEGTISGYFGPKTKEAVRRFQHAFKEDILMPYNFATSTGMVGPSTRRKLNLLLKAES